MKNWRSVFFLWIWVQFLEVIIRWKFLADWYVEGEKHYYFKPHLLNGAWVVALFIFIYGITSKRVAAFRIILTVTTLLYFAQIVKFSVLSIVFIPSDIQYMFVGAKGLGIHGFNFIPLIGWTVLLTGFLYLLLSFKSKVFKKSMGFLDSEPKLIGLRRSAMIIPFCVMVFTLSVVPSPDDGSEHRLSHAVSVEKEESIFLKVFISLRRNILKGQTDWSFSKGCRNLGFITCFASHNPTAISLPELDEEEMKRFCDDRKISKLKSQYLPKVQLPDQVIYVIVESLWDAVGTLTLKKDPLLNWRRMSLESQVGQHSSPVFGGGSLWAHYELLSGVPLSLVDNSLHPALQFPVAKMLSIPRIFSQLGYKTQIVSSDMVEFWNQDSLYADLGFEQVFHPQSDSEEDMIGWRLADQVVFKVSKELMKQAQAKKEKLFLVALPGGSHGPYTDIDRFKTREFFDDSRLSNSELDQMNMYFHLLQLADNEIGKLYDEASKDKTRKTWIIVLGDHRPPLKSALKSILELDKDRSVPILFWSSSPEERKEWRKKVLPNTVTAFYFPDLVEKLKGSLDLDARMYGEALSNLELRSPLIPRSDLPLVQDYRKDIRRVARAVIHNQTELCPAP